MSRLLPVAAPAPALALTLALVGAVGCGGDDADPGSTADAGPAAPDAAVDPLSLPVAERGPFRIGYRSFELTYELPAVAEPRTIAVDVWYPTRDSSGYAPSYLDIFRDNDAFEDAVPAGPVYDGGYPVIAYSHGDRGFGGTSSDLMGYFASHGWVAVAPSHTGNMLLDSGPRVTSHYYARAFDLSRSLDALADGAVELAGPVAVDRVLQSGHSFGVFSTWTTAGAGFDETTLRELCATGELAQVGCTEDEIQVFLAGLNDPRVVAVLAMAGGDRGWFTDSGYSDADVPALLMTGSEDAVNGQATIEAWSGVDDLAWIDVEGGCHQLFALGGCGKIGNDEGFAIVNTYALAFARKHVLDDAAADVLGVLDGSITVSERVTMVRP